jgi:hypothetical protein
MSVRINTEAAQNDGLNLLAKTLYFSVDSAINTEVDSKQDEVTSNRN